MEKGNCDPSNYVPMSGEKKKQKKRKTGLGVPTPTFGVVTIPSAGCTQSVLVQSTSNLFYDQKQSFEFLEIHVDSRDYGFVDDGARVDRTQRHTCRLAPESSRNAI